LPTLFKPPSVMIKCQCRKKFVQNDQLLLVTFEEHCKEVSRPKALLQMPLPWGQILSDNPLQIPTLCPTWGRWGVTLTGA